MSTLYTREILALALELEAERLQNPDVSVFKKSRICGSSVTIDVIFEANRIKAFGAEVEACALGQASTALMEKAAPGKTKDEINAAASQVEKLLLGAKAALPHGFESFQVFQNAKEHKARHSAILLPFKALEEAFNQTS